MLRGLLRSAVAFSLAWTCASVALAQQAQAPARPRRPEPVNADVWTTPNPGIRYLHRTTTEPSSIHAVVVDLSHPGVRIRATPYAERWRTVSEYATQNHLAVAMNGGFWGMFQRAQGVTAGGGERWPDGSDDEEVGFFAVTREGRAWMSPCERDDNNVGNARASEAVSGQPMLVRNGHVDVDALAAFENSNRRHPRSAIGVSHDGKTVIMIVADGRQGFSHGMTLYELAHMFVELGAYMALNLDGGGSSAMYVAEAGGIVNSPSGGRWEARLGLGATTETHVKPPPSSNVRVRDDGVEEVLVRGNEREVMNHIGVIAPAPGSELDVGDAGVTADAATVHEVVVVERPRPPPIRLGQTRELLYPLMYGVGIVLPVIVAVLFVRRRRARRASAANATKR